MKWQIPPSLASDGFGIQGSRDQGCWEKDVHILCLKLLEQNFYQVVHDLPAPKPLGECILAAASNLLNQIIWLGSEEVSLEVAMYPDTFSHAAIESC